jgi:hypothetical protein
MGYRSTAPENTVNVPSIENSDESSGTALARGDQSYGPSNVRKLLAQPIDMTKCKVHKLQSQLVQSANTVVTVYYRLRSKHDDSNYDTWMSNFLSIQDPVIVFTQNDMVEKVKKMRQHALNRTVIIESKPTDLPLARLGQEFWENQLRIDPEARLHKSYELFWIWLSKSWLVVQAIRLNFFESDFFFYSDIGSFRQRTYNNKLIVKYPEIVPPGAVLWMAHHPPNPPATKIWNNKRQRAHFYHSGSHGAGTAQSWLEFHSNFAVTLDAFLADRLFVGEDQVVLQSTCLLFPRSCAYVRAKQVSDNHYFGLRHVLHNGPDSAVNTPDRRYQLWRPDGWNETLRG